MTCASHLAVLVLRPPQLLETPQKLLKVIESYLAVLVLGPPQLLIVTVDVRGYGVDVRCESHLAVLVLGPPQLLVELWMLGAMMWMLGAMVWMLGAMVWMLGAQVTSPSLSLDHHSSSLNCRC
eukprot:1180629-Prorocentrum_minimum.AAC.2